MAIWLFGLISAVLLVLLGTVEGFWFDEFWLQIFGDDRLSTGLTAVLLLTMGSVLLWPKLDQPLRRAAKLVFGVLMLGLFIIKALTAYVAYEKLTPKSRHIISATAYIDTISDGVYDPVMGSAYRQVATIHHIKPASASKMQALDVYNPFNDGAMAVPALDSSAHQAMEGATVMLSAHPNFTKTNLDELSNLKPAMAVSMQLLITPIDRTVSADGFDANQWLKTRHVHANAQILSIDKIKPRSAQSPRAQLGFKLEQYRQRLRTHFYQNWSTKTYAQAQADAVTLSLMTGDRALIDKSTKDLYQLAGISHLLAISGTHVLFLAMILSTVVTGITDRFALNIYQTLPRWQIRMAVMVAASVLYALFTGFEVPAVRTVYLLMVAWLIRYFVLPIGMVSALSWVALLMIWLDPYVLWQAGFWLSFIAVLVLMRYELSEAQLASDISVLWQPKLWPQAVWQLAKLQFWLFFAMLPLSILLFGKISIWGLVVNLFAIGLFGFVVVPLNLLAGSLFWLLPQLADGLWFLASSLLYALHEALNFSLGHQLGAISAWWYAPFTMAGFLLCFLLVGLLILPKVLPRSLMMMPILAIVFLASDHSQPSLVLIHLPTDSQQTSQLLLIQSDGQKKRHWLILNDLGAKSLRANHANTLIDQLHRQGVARSGLDGVIVQSTSAIFMPMIAELATRMPVHRYWQAGDHQPLVSLRHEPCQAGMTWQADGLMLRALTGWHEIDDERVQHCEIELLSDQSLTVMGMPMASDALPDIMEQSSNTKNKTQLIFNTSSEPLLWQLWEMMCASDESLKITNDLTHQRYWLSTSRTANSDALNTKLSDALQIILE